MKRGKFFVLIISFLFIISTIILNCDKRSDSPSKQTKEPKPEEAAPTYKTPSDYYKSLFTKSSVKDLEGRVFTGLTIMERLGKRYIYQLPNGSSVIVDYLPKSNPCLFIVKEEFPADETSFELYADLEIFKISRLDYILKVFLTPIDLFYIFELENGKLTSIWRFRRNYSGTLFNQEFTENDEAMQKHAEEFCCQFFEKKYKPLKTGLKTDDFYRIYCKALKKELNK